MAAFDLETFIASCCEAATEDQPVLALRDVMEAAVQDGDAIERSIGHLVDETLGLLHRLPTLTIQHGIFAPGYATGIHDHTVSAVIGTWSGYEDNRFFRPAGDHLEDAGGKRCGAGEVLVLGPDVIHEVHAPAGRWVAGFHVYLGDLRAIPRSCWDAVDAPEARYDGAAFVQRWLPTIEAAGLRR